MIKTSSDTVYYTQQDVNDKINEVMEDGYRITNAVYEKAKDMQWCNEYDDWAEELNKSLKFFEVPIMRREYAVTYSIVRAQTAQVTVTVTATDTDDAEDQAGDEYNMNDLLEKIDDNEWETSDVEIDETEAQEV